MPPRVVDIHNRPLGTRFLSARRQVCKQAQLRLKVVFHRPVIIEMILREIREDRGVVFASARAVHRQGVRRDLHDGY